MPIAIGHTEDAYNYYVSGTDGSTVPLLKVNLAPHPTWAQLAAAAGMDYLAVPVEPVLVGAAEAVPEPVVEPTPMVEAVPEPAVGAPSVEPAVEAQP